MAPGNLSRTERPVSAHERAEAKYRVARMNACAVERKRRRENLLPLSSTWQKRAMATQGAGPSIAFNADYIRTRPGILRILEACVSLCGVISVSQSYVCSYHGIHSFYNFVVVSTLILAIIILIIFLIGLDKLCAIINFPLSIFINDALFSVLYLVAAILMFVTIPCKAGLAARIVAALFGLFGAVVVGLLALDGYHVVRGGAQPKNDPA